MKGNYDNVAPYYNMLSRLIYGDAILQAERFLVNAISANSFILIVGGGTGQILEEISKKYESGLQITYVDISAKMIELSKKRVIGNNRVNFINQAIADVAFNHRFDVVITSFFFDNFSACTAKLIFDKIHTLLKPEALWLFSDFQLSEKNSLWQKLLLNSMYFFFRFLCGIEASHLPDTDFLFQKYKYQCIFKQTFYKKFIYSSIYLKPVN